MTLLDIFADFKKDTLEGKMCLMPYKKEVSKKNSEKIIKIYPCNKKVPYSEENRCRKTHQCGAYLAFTRDGITNYKVLKKRYASP